MDIMERGPLSQQLSQLQMLMLMLTPGILPMDMDMVDMDIMERGLLMPSQQLSQLLMLMLMLMLGILPMDMDMAMVLVIMDMDIDMVVMDMQLTGHMDMDIMESSSANK